MRFVLFLLCLTLLVADDEILIPERSVRVSGRETKVSEFYLDRTEVTQKAYHEQAQSLGLMASRFVMDTRYNQPDQPVNGVNWHDAYSYCRARGKRLPTYAEFVSASMGKWMRRYAWGTDFEDLAPFRTAVQDPVSTYKVTEFQDYASSEGVYMLGGNVAEWLLDEGPFQHSRLVAGGSFASLPEQVQVGARGYYPAADNSQPTIGFRCARLARTSKILTQEELVQAVSDKTRSLDILVKEQEAIEAKRRQKYLQKLSYEELSRRQSLVTTHNVEGDRMYLPEAVFPSVGSLKFTSSFAIDIRPVSVKDFQVWIKEGGRPALVFVTGLPRLHKAPDHAAKVPYADAQAYCVSRGGRLATDAEWERSWHLMDSSSQTLTQLSDSSSYSPMQRLTATGMEWTDSLLFESKSKDSLFRVTRGPLPEEQGVSSRHRRGAILYSRHSFRCVYPQPPQFHFPVTLKENYWTKEFIDSLKDRIAASENVFNIDFRSLEFEKALQNFLAD